MRTLPRDPPRTSRTRPGAFAVPIDASDALARALRAAVKAVAFDEDNADALARAAMAMLEPPEPVAELEAPAGAA